MIAYAGYRRLEFGSAGDPLEFTVYPRWSLGVALTPI